MTILIGDLVKVGEECEHVLSYDTTECPLMDKFQPGMRRTLSIHGDPVGEVEILSYQIFPDEKRVFIQSRRIA